MCHATPDSSCDLPSSLQAPSLARDFVKSQVCADHAHAAEAALALLADELVTQAIVYGAPPVSLTLRCATSEVTVEVADSSPDVRSPQVAGHTVGLLLIDKIARSWGTQRTGTGKIVWCKVPSGATPQGRSSHPWSPSSEPADDPVDTSIAGARKAGGTAGWPGQERTRVEGHPRGHPLAVRRGRAPDVGPDG